MSEYSGDDGLEAIGEPSETKPEFTGRGAEIFGIWILNLVLSIITLGIYSFWGRVNIRRYLWQSTRYEDEAFEYTGTGGELFIGFLIVFFIVLLPISAANFFAQNLLLSGNEIGATAVGVATYAAIVFLIGVAIHRVRKYRLSRTLWRGIRGALGGSSIRYGLLFFGYMALNAVTLGLAYPYTTVQLWSRLANDTWIGSGRLRFEGSARPLYRSFLIPWGLAAVAVGLIAWSSYLAADQAASSSPDDTKVMAGAISQKMVTGMISVLPLAGVLFFVSYQWFRAARYRLFAEGTTFEDTVSFKLDLSGVKLFGFTLLNYFLLIVTLGFATSYILIRGGRLIADRLTIIGEPDFEAISQSTAEMPKFGEGLGEAFDVGGF